MAPPLVLSVKVKPNSGRSALEQLGDSSWVASLKALPVDGKANDELITLLARRFKCRKADVSIKRGGSGRMKLVQIELG